MTTYKTTDGEVTDLAGHLLVCDVGKPCFLCGSSGGELFSSTAENHPFHKPCIDKWRGELVGSLDALRNFVEEDLAGEESLRLGSKWDRLKRWIKSLKP